MDIIQSFLKLVHDIEPVTLILTAYGLVLIITAFIKSYYLPFIFSGVVSICAAAAIRILNGGGLAQVFIMTFIILGIITTAYIISVRFSKYGWIIRMPVISESAEEKDYSIDSRDKT